MKKLILLIALTLTACATTQQPGQEPVVQPTVTVTKYVIKVPPAQLMTIPPQVPPVSNIDTANQGDVAKWLTENETRTTTLENMIKSIGVFFGTEQAKLDEQAKTENEAAQKKALDDQKKAMSDSMQGK